MSGLESGAGGFEPEDSEGQSQLQLDVTPAMRFFAVPVVHVDRSRSAGRTNRPSHRCVVRVPNSGRELLGAAAINGHGRRIHGDRNAASWSSIRPPLVAVRFIDSIAARPGSVTAYVTSNCQ